MRRVLACILVMLSVFTFSSIGVSASTSGASPALSLQVQAKTIKAKKTYTIKVKIPKPYKKKDLVWKSNKPTIVSVNQNGKVKGHKRGSAVITVSIPKTRYKAKCTIYVGTPVSRVSLNTKAIVMDTSKQVFLKATVAPKNASNKKVLWESSNENILTVSKNGVITAHNLGFASVTAITQDGNKKAICNITVTKSPQQIQEEIEAEERKQEEEKQKQEEEKQKQEEEKQKQEEEKQKQEEERQKQITELTLEITYKNKEIADYENDIAQANLELQSYNNQITYLSTQLSSARAALAAAERGTAMQVYVDKVGWVWQQVVDSEEVNRCRSNVASYEKMINDYRILIESSNLTIQSCQRNIYQLKTEIASINEHIKLLREAA